MQSFPIRLVYPPQGHFTQPYLALPCIKAWLHKQGWDDVGLVDASIEAYDRFLSREYLERAKRLHPQLMRAAELGQRVERGEAELGDLRALGRLGPAREGMVGEVAREADAGGQHDGLLRPEHVGQLALGGQDVADGHGAGQARRPSSSWMRSRRRAAAS